MSNLGELETADDLFSEFGSPQKASADCLQEPCCRRPVGEENELMSRVGEPLHTPVGM